MGLDMTKIGNFVTQTPPGPDFEVAAKITLSEDVEGGEANIPGDTGGFTKYGISSKAYPNEDIANMTPQRARYLAKRDYWFPLRADMISSQKIANNLFDFAFHHGVRGVVKKIQILLHWEYGFAGKVDGIMGSQTLSYINQIIAAGQGPASDLHIKLLQRRIQYYLDTAKPNVLKGFIRRASFFF